ncbi:MAG: WD40 repeat domain-containing protein [Anaerolineae bacterium]|nr:WD40 repeat domain-containing protein [Anaerolineae bacterium]MDW8173032.1 WD40 repeat domain-containing protein [Anaerolineae bacterium]
MARYTFVSFLALLIALGSHVPLAQDIPSAISADNVSLLRPARLLSFDPQRATVGWLALADGGSLALREEVDRLALYDDQGNSWDTLDCPDFAVAQWIDSDTLVAACLLPQGFSLRRWSREQLDEWDFTELDFLPFQVWGDGQALYAELQARDPSAAPRVLRATSAEDVDLLPYPPADDPQAVVRIGRITPPYVVTSSLDGQVSLWDMTSGKRIAQVDNGTGKPSVFGNINASATHLAWRDNDNRILYLLDLRTGENRVVAPLNGEYVQWFFVSSDASLILGVGVGGAPSVVAWRVSDGQRLELGLYHAERPCSRPQPDMAQLSPDGRILAIGCSAGVELWQVSG